MWLGMPKKDRGNVARKKIVSHILCNDLPIRIEQIEVARAKLCGNFESDVE